jgi:hypothetical protein
VGVDWFGVEREQLTSRRAWSPGAVRPVVGAFECGLGLMLELLSACSAGGADAPTRGAQTTPGSNKTDTQGGGNAEQLASWGTNCEEDSDCAKGSCVLLADRSGYDEEGYCTKSCKKDADCPAEIPVCGVGPDGEGMCAAPCSELPFGMTCIDERPVACSALTGSCTDCGCADELRCDVPTGMCAAKGEVGEYCQDDEDCRTGNCGLYHHVCRTPIGSPCDTTNCDLCLSNDNWSYCSRECTREYCGATNDLCLGDEYEDLFFCRPPCQGASDPSCPDGCDYGGGEYYCRSVTSASPTRPLGSTCHAASDCESGNCYQIEWCFAFHGCNMGEGYCTAPCSNDDECGVGLRCVDMPCSPSEITVAGETAATCGAMCLRDCTVTADVFGYQPCVVSDGSCRELPSVATNELVKVCDVRLPNEHYCRSSTACFSGRCEDEVCFPAGGQANGIACAGNEDCLSGVCSGGTCRGTALLGDPCVGNPDCAVGTCCSGTCCN